MERVKIPVVMTTIEEHEKEIQQNNLGLDQESLEDAYWWLYCDTEDSHIFVDPEEIILIQDVSEGFSRIYVGHLTSFITPKTAAEVNELL